MPIVTMERLELLTERKRGRRKAGFGQLIVCMAGAAVVSVDRQRWPMSPRRMLWLPDGVAYTANAASKASLCCLSFESALLTRLDMNEVLSEPFVATTNDLVWEAVRAKLDTAASVERRDILAQVILMEIRGLRYEVIAE